MKSTLSLLALGLCGIGIVNAQTTNTSTTTTNSTYSTAPVTTDSSNRSNMNNSSMSNGSTTNNGTMTNTSGTMNTNGTTSGSMTNSTAAPTYGTTTTTTTTVTNSDNNSMSTSTNQRNDGDKPWGKEGKFGIYAGVNFSRFINEPIPDGAYRAGWQAGIYGRSGGTIFGQIGLEYRNSTTNLVRTGAGQPTPTAGEVRGRIDQHFLAIPAYVGVRVGSALGLRIQAGAELASLVAIGKNNFNLGADDLNRTILNGLVGAGINLGPLTLDALYNHGFVNVFDKGADTKRNILALNLGFRF